MKKQKKEGEGNTREFLCSLLRKEAEQLWLATQGDKSIGDRSESQKSGPRQARTYNGIDEAIILRANEHYCQRDVDKNGRANHKIPCGVRTQNGLAHLESGKNRTDRLAVQIDRTSIASLILCSVIYYL